MITYTESLDGVTADRLGGFFQGWRRVPSPEQHLAILGGSDHVVLAVDADTGRVVGFITVLTDHVQAAFVPLLEVLPEYRGQGLGSELVRRVLARFAHLPALDLTCDPELQGFYQRLGMQPSVGMIVRHYQACRLPRGPLEEL